MSLHYVNFEFPLARQSDALQYLGAFGLIAPGAGLHLYETQAPSGESDSGVQVRAKALTAADDAAWFLFCEAFSQDCVALVPGADNGAPDYANGRTVGPHADAWPFDRAFFVLP